MPVKCSMNDAINKMRDFPLEKLSNSEIEWINTVIHNFKDVNVTKCGFLIRQSNHNIVVNKLQDNWFTLVIDYGSSSMNNEYYICDEFDEVKSYIQSII